MGFFDDDPELTDFQKKQLISFVDEVNRLNIRTSNDNLFLKEFMQHINELDTFYGYKSPWILENGVEFRALTEELQKETLAIITPILGLTKKYLKTIAPYDELMEHIIEHRKLMKMYYDAKKDGGDIHIAWSFFDKFRPKIGDQWFGLAHLVCYYEAMYPN